MPLIELGEKPDRALLVSVDTGKFDAESSISELEELVKSAGAIPELTVIQKLDRPETASFVGSGKLAEIKEICGQREIDLIVCDSELSPTQIKTLEKETDVRTIDRTTLILDIFALRARSKEGKLQVELAQLKYLLPRLEQLRDVENHRARLRERREKDGVITVAIVGYTNAGKSTLMNYLTDAGVLEEDKLFATLDPTLRALKLPSGVTVMLIDTVGLVRRLPHGLVEAFKSTLEEAALSDIILNVCDASSDEADVHAKVTADLLAELGCGDTPIINVLNKCDRLNALKLAPDSENIVHISAKTGEGVARLLEAIDRNLPVRIKRIRLLLPFSKAGLLNEIREKATLISENYTAEGIEVEAIIDEGMYRRVKEFEA